MAFSTPRRLLGKLKRVLLSILPNCVCTLEFSGQYVSQNGVLTSSKKTATGTPSAGNRRGRDTSVNTVNSGRQALQQYSINYTPTQAYAPPPMHYQQQLLTQQVYYSTPPASFPSPAPHNYAPALPPIQQSRPPASRTPQPVQRAPAPQDQQGTVPWRKQFTPLPAPLSHIYRQLLAGNRIRPVAPNPDFDPTIQDQSRHCDVCAIGEYETGQELSAPFIIEYVPAETGVGYAGFDATPVPFVIEVPARESYQDSKVPWTYEGNVRNLEHQFSVMGVTRSGRVYENPEAANKRKAPAATLGIAPEATLIPQKKVTEEEAEAFMKIIKASEYKVPKETAPDLIEETVGSIFSNNISFWNDKLPAEGPGHDRQWFGSQCMPCFHPEANECGFESYSSKQDSGSSLRWLAERSERRDRPSDRSRSLFIQHHFQVLDIPNAFSLLLGRPWIHSAGAVPSTLHQNLKFIVEERLITVKGEEDYAIYKEMVVPYINIGDDQNLSFHSFDTISVIRDYGKAGSSCADRMVGKILLRHNYIPAHYGKINRGTPVPPLSHFFSGPQHIVGGTLDGPSSDSNDALVDLLGICAVTEETPSGVYIRLAHRRGTPHAKDRDGPRPNTTSSDDRFPEGVPRGLRLVLCRHAGLRSVDSQALSPARYRELPAQTAAPTVAASQPSPPHQGGGDEVYVDDMIAKSKEGEDHLVNLRRLFERLKQYKLRLNQAKCTFGAKSGKLLGFVVSERGIKVDPDKVKAIRELPPPSTMREVRSFLGRLNYIARFIANLSNKCQPHFRLLRKNAAIEWDDDYQKAFDDIKTYLVQSPVLVPPTPGRPPILYLTVRRDFDSTLSIRLLSKADPLKYLLGSPSSMRNIAKWRCQLTEYDIEYDDTPINFDFPDEGILQVDEEEDGTAWKMYFDGAVNSTGSGIGAVMISQDGCYYPIAAKVDFSCTNNMAEYEACILDLQAAIDFKTKDAKLLPYHEYLEELAKNFEKISFTYTPRIKNQFEDALATLASMVSITKENIIEPLEIEIAKGPAYCDTIEATDEQPWYEDIKHFLQTGQYPTFANRRDQKTLRRLAAHYFLSRETLYRRSFDTTLLRCVDENEAQRLMGEIHEGSCGPHMSGLMLT
ncbi:hypothetical protein CRG98_006630 [Punica granatum]|uniref:Reverse transcriptase domain-containing protein n=1 Tax=Punica granatum TaxID=22663 RepID=A0A2I0KX74_PUNGR|nr:hypothetical protein CRG98_006630 [Punica granatum]